MVDFLTQLAGTLPIVGALLLVGSANVARSRRVSQLPMPAIAVLYAIAALIAFYLFNDWFDAVLERIFGWVPVLRGWYETRWLYVIENAIALLCFAVLKVAINPVLSRAFRGADFPGSSVASAVYHYDTDYGLWFLRPRSGMLRVYYRALYWGSVAVAAILIALLQMLPGWPGFLAVAFPSVAVLVVGELFFAVDGLTRTEFQQSITGERDDSDRLADYGALRRVLRDTFAGRVLADGINLSSEATSDGHEVLEELSRSQDDLDRLTAGYFLRLEQEGSHVDPNLVNAALGLMRGHSALINNPFYDDLTAYLSFPAYYHLLHYRKCLVITGRDAIAKDLTDWVADGLETITGIPDLWRVEVLGEHGHDDLDVGVLRFADIHNLDLIRANDEFFAEVEFVILAEPSRMLATGQLGLGLILARCARGRRPVYAAFDRNHDGLVDALSHLLKTTLTDVVASALPHGASSEMVWRADGPPMHAAILPTITRYLGMGTEIGAVALKYQVSQVQWVGADKFPVTDMMWIAGQYYGQIGSFADLELSQHVIADSIVPVGNPWGMPQAENRFLVVEDEIANVYETVRLYSTRATRQGLVNLISEDYLLRDYMVDNRDIFSTDPKAIPSIVPDFARTERNTVLRMILTLVCFEVCETDLAREFELIGRPVGRRPEEVDDDESPVLAQLRVLIALHTGVEQVRVASRWGEPAGMPGGALVGYLRILPGSGLDDVVASLRSAYFYVEDESEDTHVIGGCQFGHAYQTALPGQFVTVAGKYYEVTGVATAAFRHGIVLRRAAEHVSERRTYRPLRAFELSDVRPAATTGSRIAINGVEILRQTATVKVSSAGYIEAATRSDVGGGRRVEVAGIPERRYTAKDILEIRLPGIEPAVRRTVTTLLNELFVTVFPGAYNYLVALTEDDDGDCGDLLPGLVRDDARVSSIFVVEDSMIDLGLIVAVERSWQRIFAIVTDYLLWSTTPRPAESGGGAPDSGPPVFPDDAPEDVAARERAAAETEGGRRGLLARLIAALRRLVRRGPRPGRAEDEATPRPVTEDLEVSIDVPGGDPGASDEETNPAGGDHDRE